MGVQIHASGSRGGHGGPDTRQGIQKGPRGSRYTPVNPHGVTRVQIHTSRSRGGHGGPDTHQQIHRGSRGSRHTPGDPEGATGV